LAVLDLDGPEADVLAEELCLRDAPTVQTGEGLHIYYSIVAATRSVVGLRSGIDLRADGGYMVAPPSIYPTGAVYTWRIGLDQELPLLPEWARRTEVQADAKRKTRWVATALRGVEVGQRNTTCARLAGHFLAHGEPFDVVEATLLAWNGRNLPPLPEEEVRKTVAAIVARSHRQRIEALPDTERTLLEFLSGPWSKDCTHGERSTYQAVCIIEYSRGLPPGTPLVVSYRELQSRGAVSYQRVGSVLGRLKARGYLEFEPAGRAGGQRGQAAKVRRVLPLILR
jgi:hypothetical protein